MGGGFYCYTGAKLKADTLKMAYTTYAAELGDFAARSQIFVNKEMDPEMNISGKTRECLDSDEHPNTTPIIIALDVTGSMGKIPNDLITDTFPELMKKIQEENVPDPQVCFIAVGDHECDRAPLQCGQFESSDDLIEKWLKKIYIEGGGGGNDGESYLLAWYFAARHTHIDAFEKRGKKGILVTIGDEPTLKDVPVYILTEIFGGAQTAASISDILTEASEKWDVYHINVPDYRGSRAKTQSSWKELLGDHMVNAQSSKGEDIADIIAGIVISSVNGVSSESASGSSESASGPTGEGYEFL